MGLQAERVFNMKLLAAYVSEWSAAAKGRLSFLLLNDIINKINNFIEKVFMSPHRSGRNILFVVRIMSAKAFLSA